MTSASPLTKGGNVPLSSASELSMEVSAYSTRLDLTVLYLGADGKVRSDADMIFFNQPRSVDGAVTVTGHNATFDLQGIEDSVSRIIIAVSPDDDVDTFDTVVGLRVDIANLSGDSVIAFELDPTSNHETLIIAAEIYRRGDEWKIRHVGQGYANGLAGFATDYGISLDEDSVEAIQTVSAPPVAPVPEPSKLDLKKAAMLATPATGAAPVDLRKHRVAVILEKAGILGTEVDVVIVSDHSGSIYRQYDSGVMSRTIERLYPVACRLDPDNP